MAERDSGRNFPNRLGQSADLYLAPAELASVDSILGELPTVAEYIEYANTIDSMSKDIYRYLNFDQMAEYQDVADKVKIPTAQVV